MRTPRIRHFAALAGMLGLAAPAAALPAKAPERIVMVDSSMTLATGRALIIAAGGTVTRTVPIIHGFGARLDSADLRRLKRVRGMRVVTNRRVGAIPGAREMAAKPASSTTSTTTTTTVSTTPSGTPLLTAFNQSVGTDQLWASPYYATGKGVTVAVIDTGIAGDLVDFRRSPTDATSRVLATVVTNPEATTATDTYGHGTHVAGLIAGNGFNRPTSDKLFGKYAGTAPNAQLVSIKASDDHGNATLLDVIYGLQFAVDNRATYNIRVVNLSLESTVAQSATTDPLDAALESAWLHGIVVVAAAGNRGTATDATWYAPGNDPYAISVGAVDDKGTKTLSDDALATWSSRGLTQDGRKKPEVLAPGARLVSVLAPNSDFVTACPTCIVSGQYIRLGGTSMSAAVTSGVVADLLQLRPTLTPDQVKALLMGTTRTVSGVGPEISASSAAKTDITKVPKVNVGLTPNTLVDATTGDIDYTRASWSRASWSTAIDPLRASWSSASWSCACSLTSSGTIDPARASWSRASWSSAWDK